jgi:hypothetical protein
MIMLVSCSNEELEQDILGVLPEVESTRADLKEYTIENLEAGTLRTVMKERNMTDAQKLIITGSISSNDITYLNQTNVISLDLSNASISEDNLNYIPLGFFSGSELQNIVLPKELDNIDARGFYNCSKLENIEIPASVTDIGDRAFYGCTSLLSIQIPEGVSTLGEEAFYNCGRLESVFIPGSVKAINNSTFEGCIALRNVEISDGVGEIGEKAFRNCYYLNNVNIPGSVSSIGEYAFWNCIGLYNLTLSEGLKEICDRAFWGCSTLYSIKIPEGITTIKRYTFRGCHLYEMEVPSTLTEFEGGFSMANYLNLNKLVWNSSINLGDLTQDNNLYCWLILSHQNGELPLYGANWKNVVIDGVAQDIKLPYHIETNYSIPDEVKTINKISYVVSFNTEYTQWGDLVGYLESQWTTISLPFKPTSITHAEKGLLAPFDSDIEGIKEFWLRELTTDGFVDVPAIEANHAYIIAMPNSSEYESIYNITGDVTFSAENVDYEHLDHTLVPAVGSDYTMYPSSVYQLPVGSVYVLSDEEFVNDLFDVYPFEAYAKSNTGTLRSVFSMNSKRVATRVTTGSKGLRKPQKDDM